MKHTGEQMKNNEPIENWYVEWANSLDSTGKDSTEAFHRLVNIETLANVLGVLRTSVTVGHLADAMKKWVFYGKEPERGFKHMSQEGVYPMSLIRMTHENIRILHALVGLMSETAELVEMFIGHVVDDVPFDMQNFNEESGDLMWYIALLARAANHSTLEPFMMSNYTKLVKRYPSGAWTQEDAINRDTVAEMKALDDGLAKADPIAKYPTLTSIVSQLSACMYEDRTRRESIETNEAFKALRAMASQEEQKW
jgi:NTP pyrophosphatase (non-canonical NTP hydrolase)